MLRNEKKKALDKMVAATAENKLKCLNLVSPEDTIKSDSIQLSKNEAPTKQDSLKSAEVKLYLSSLIAEAELLKLKKKTLVSQANKPSGKQVLSGYNPNYSNPSFENIHLRSSAKKEPQLPRKDVSNEKLPPITNTKISFIDMSIDDIEGKTVYVTRTKSSDKNPSLILRSRPQYHDSKIEVKGSPSVTQTQSFLEPEPVKSDFFFKPRASGKPRFWVIPRSG